MTKKKIAATGERAPEFTLRDQNNNETSLETFQGKWIVLYFYPKDMTPGCTIEAIDFTKYKENFEKLGAVIIGISPDSTIRHCKFIEKHDLSIVLLSDPDHTAMDAYGVWQKKKMYGKESMGVVRSTFLIDPRGTIRESWTKVKVNGHVQEVKEKLKQLTIKHS